MRVSGYTTRTGKRVGAYTRRPGFRPRKPRSGAAGRSMLRVKAALPPTVDSIAPGKSAVIRRKSKKHRRNRSRSIYDPKRRKRSSGPLTKPNTQRETARRYR